MPKGGHPNSLANLVGKPGNPGKPKGALTKTQMTHQLRQDIFNTYKSLSGEEGMDYLSVVATEYPQVFCSLLAKLIPQEIKAELGRPGEFDHMTDEQLKQSALIQLVKCLPEKEYLKIEPYIESIGGNGSEDAGGVETPGSVEIPDPVHQEDLSELPAGEAPSPDSEEARTG